MAYTQTEIKYIRPNRTVECYKSTKLEETFFIYNYKGYHFRLFQNRKELNNFFEHGIEPALDFDDEKV